MPQLAPPLLVICGPTATGKTGLSIRLAEALAADGIDAEIVSADSRQVYRGMDIGTAKPPVAERRGIAHHGIDLVDPDATFTLADYAAHARSALAAIAARGRLAVLVGGTGLYLRSVGRGMDTESLPHDPELRALLEAELAMRGVSDLAERLTRVAPTIAAGTDLRNPRRVVRALERAQLVGDRPAEPPAGYGGRSAWLGLDLDRQVHRTWIVERARGQFASGLIDEAADLRTRFDPSLPAFSAIGYREAWAVIDGHHTLDHAVHENVQRNVQFARRQRTWFRAEPGIQWLDATRDPLAAAVAVARGLLD